MDTSMKLYYVAYDYGVSEIEYLDGPYGARWEAANSRNELSVHFDRPDKVIVVVETRIVEWVAI